MTEKFLIKLYRNNFPSLISILKKELNGCQSVLDLGCGKDSPIQYCDISFSVGVDLFEPYLKESKKKKIHSKYVKADIRKINFHPKSFDGVVALDVLEHLTKREGSELIKKMEKFAKKKVIIFTPNNFLEQEEYENNPLQRHQSGWNLEELQSRGYRIYGINGLKFLRKEKAEIKFRPKIFWSAVSLSTQLLVVRYPSHAFQLLAIKDIEL